MSREITIWLKSEDKAVFGFEEDNMLHLNKLLYKLYYAGDYWELKICDHLLKDTGIHQIIEDPALYIKLWEDVIIGMAGYV